MDCACRETQEETGITIKNMQFGPYTQDVFIDTGTHYITIYVISEFASGEVVIMEPEKCCEWRWCTWDALPRPLFLPVQHLLEQGFDPFSDTKT